jgi:hypothetical protein
VTAIARSSYETVKGRSSDGLFHSHADHAALHSIHIFKTDECVRYTFTSKETGIDIDSAKFGKTPAWRPHRGSSLYLLLCHLQAKRELC